MRHPHPGSLSLSQASVDRTSGPEPTTQWNFPDLAALPADEHRLLLHDLFARLITDPQMGLTVPQVLPV